VHQTDMTCDNVQLLPQHKRVCECCMKGQGCRHWTWVPGGVLHRASQIPTGQGLDLVTAFGSWYRSDRFTKVIDNSAR
jgi:hypothetical protein